MSNDDRPMSTADLANAGETHSSETQPINQPDQQTDHETQATLLPDEEVAEFRHRWDAIQTGFVDEPRRAVESADALVAAAMKRLAEVFAFERAQLEGQWDRGDDVSTEDLRLALQRYRAFFGRLLSL